MTANALMKTTSLGISARSGNVLGKGKAIPCMIEGDRIVPVGDETEVFNVGLPVNPNAYIVTTPIDGRPFVLLESVNI